jgi:acyl-CoA hydrolase
VREPLGVRSLDPVPAAAVLDLVPPEADVIVPLANGEPATVLDAIEREAPGLTGVRIHQMHALRDRPSIRGELGDHVRHVSYFLSPVTRPAFWAGTVDLVPNHFSEVPLLLQRTTKCSLVVAAASLPDRHGYFSLGTNADYVTALIGRAPFFLEANPHMPRTYGENQLHMSQIAGWCHAEYPLIEVPSPELSAKERRIGEMIAERVPNGATFQVGIGSVATAVLAALRDHRELGVHTELLSDGMMDLVDRGVVTGTRKRHRRNKVVTTFCLGSGPFYRWLHENAAVELLPVDWVNSPLVVAREPNFVSVNATTEVDLYGQCASETVAGRYWSSSGGQADFARGAMYSEGGMAFIALPSTTRDGRSRIRVQLSPGSVVTTLKNTVDHVVTEHGVAELRGLSLRDRARALIAIADPSVRDDLAAEAAAAGLLRE